MDKSQETKFMALIEGLATATGQPHLYDEILALLKENSELSQKVSQIYTVQDEALQSLGDEYSIREVEVSLRRNENNFRREINEIVDDLTSVKNFAEMQLRRMVDRIKTEEPTVQNIQKIVSEKTGISASSEPTQPTTDLEFTLDQSAKIDELTKRPPEDLFREMDVVLADSKALVDKINQVVENALVNQIQVIITLYQFRIAYAQLLILNLRKLFKKYTFQRHMLRVKQEAIRIFFLLIILTLGVGLFFSLITVWWLSLLLLPTIAWLLIDHYIQPYLEKRLFNPGKRKDLKKLLSDFYDRSILARCSIALAQNCIQTPLFKDDLR